MQILSGLNRARSAKSETFVLEYYDDAESIQRTFELYYRISILAAVGQVER